jgi:hypothetical protein
MLSRSGDPLYGDQASGAGIEMPHDVMPSSTMSLSMLKAIVQRGIEQRDTWLTRSLAYRELHQVQVWPEEGSTLQLEASDKKESKKRTLLIPLLVVRGVVIVRRSHSVRRGKKVSGLPLGRPGKLNFEELKTCACRWI